VPGHPAAGKATIIILNPTHDPVREKATLASAKLDPDVDVSCSIHEYQSPVQAKPEEMPMRKRLRRRPWERLISGQVRHRDQR
jgi:hypothetical protein